MTYEGGDRREKSGLERAFEDFASHMLTLTTDHKEELERHTESNNEKMQVLVAGQQRNERTLTELKESQIRTEGKIENIQANVSKIEGRQEKNSEEINRLQADNETAKNQRSTLFHKVDELESGPKSQQGFWQTDNAKYLIWLGIFLVVGLIGLAGYNISIKDIA